MSPPTAPTDRWLGSAPTAAGPIGLLLIGHGTRNPAGQAEMLELSARVAARRADVASQPCWLEFASPNIDDGVRNLIDRGVQQIVAMPLLLFAAGHVKQDIPAALSAAAERHPGLSIRLAGYLGCHPRVVALSALRFNEVLSGNESVSVRPDRAETLLLLVGRGSRDPEANAEMAQFARLVFEQTQVGWCEVCFTAMAEPSLARGLDFVATTSYSQIVVQPHLLFRGELLERIGAAQHARHQMGEKRWLLAEHLGVHDFLVDAVLEIAGF